MKARKALCLALWIALGSLASVWAAPPPAQAAGGADLRRSVALALQELAALEVLLDMNLTAPQQLALLDVARKIDKERELGAAAALAELNTLLDVLSASKTDDEAHKDQADELRLKLTKWRREPSAAVVQATQEFLDGLEDEQWKRLREAVRSSGRPGSRLDEKRAPEQKAGRSTRPGQVPSGPGTPTGDALEHKVAGRLDALRAAEPAAAKELIQKLEKTRRELLVNRGYSKAVIDKDAAELRAFLERVRGLDGASYASSKEKLTAELTQMMRAVGGETMKSAARREGAHVASQVVRWLGEPGTDAALERLARAGR